MFDFIPTEVAVALIVGGLAFLGTIYSTNKNHSLQEQKQTATIEAIQAEYKASIELIKTEFKGNCDLIMEKIKQLEKKQDKHNSLIERMTKAENAIKDLQR